MSISAGLPVFVLVDVVMSGVLVGGGTVPVTMWVTRV